MVPTSDVPFAASTRDFAAYLKLVHRNWSEFFGQFNSGYRHGVDKAIAFRNTVAHQRELDCAEFDDAVDTLSRLEVFIEVERVPRDKRRLLARSRSVEAIVATRSAGGAATVSATTAILPHSELFVVPVETLTLLTPALERFVRLSLWRAVATSTNDRSAAVMPVEVVLSTQVERRQHTTNVSAFEAKLRFVDDNWSVVFDTSRNSNSNCDSSNCDDSVKETLNTHRAAAKRIVAFHRAIAGRVALQKSTFEDAVDALERFAVVIGADKFATVKLRALLDPATCRRSVTRRESKSEFRRDDPRTELEREQRDSAECFQYAVVVLRQHPQRDGEQRSIPWQLAIQVVAVLVVFVLVLLLELGADSSPRKSGRRWNTK